MGANAQTTVPTFTAGQVLTAAQMNDSARTGVPVFAGTTERDAAFGGTGEKALAEGQLCYLESTNVVQYYDGAAWATVGPASAGALVYITGAAFTTQTAVSLPNNTFTSTYRNYKVIFEIPTVATNASATIRFRTSGTDNSTAIYYQGSVGVESNGTANNGGDAASTSFGMGEIRAGTPVSLSVDVIAPQISTTNHYILGTYQSFSFTNARVYGRSLAMITSGGSAFSADSLSFISSVASNLTGIYRVYAYSDS